MRIILSIILATGLFANHTAYGQEHTIQKGVVIYDFSFADLAIQYLETTDTAYLNRIAELDAIKHLLNHASHFGNDTQSTEVSLATRLLSPTETQKERLELFKRNVSYAKSLAEDDFPQIIALQYLPKDFQYSSSLFFTFGYDLGVAYGNNASVNLAHPHYLKDMNEIRYYSIHELHHAGFMMIKESMPSLDIHSYEQMAQVIEFCTHLEGVATYAPLETRIREGAMEADEDYVALQNPALMREYEEEFFDIYLYFKNNPDGVITEDDWDKLNILSDQKRLWYRVGALMAQTIDQKLGREKLVSLIAEPSENFITTYLQVRE